MNSHQTYTCTPWLRSWGLRGKFPTKKLWRNTCLSGDVLLKQQRNDSFVSSLFKQTVTKFQRKSTILHRAAHPKLLFRSVARAPGSGGGMGIKKNYWLQKTYFWPLKKLLGSKKHYSYEEGRTEGRKEGTMERWKDEILPKPRENIVFLI